MSKSKEDESTELSAEDMRGWLNEEVHNVLKEGELRVRDATQFATAYAAGKMTRKEANKRFYRYYDRWSDPLSGHYASSFKTDDAIVAAIDNEHKAHRERRNRYDQLYGREGSVGPRGR